MADKRFDTYDAEVAPAAPQVSDEAKAAIRARLAHHHGQAGAAATKPSYQKVLADEVRRVERNGLSDFPTGAIVAAVKATDVLLPAQLEDQILNITRMYLEKVPSKTIAERLGLPPELVQQEIRKINIARSVAIADNPAVVPKVLSKHLEVVQDSADLIRDAFEILKMVKEEIEMDFDAKRNAAIEDPEKARKIGIKPMLLQNYWAGLDAIGHHQQRIAEILGLMKQKDTINLTQTNQTINFGSEQLNQLADQFLRAAGSSPINLERSKDVYQAAKHPTIEVQNLSTEEEEA